jgi:hypothetical protein
LAGLRGEIVIMGWDTSSNLLKWWAGDDPTTRMHVNSACFFPQIFFRHD